MWLFNKVCDKLILNKAHVKWRTDQLLFTEVNKAKNILKENTIKFLVLFDLSSIPLVCGAMLLFPMKPKTITFRKK